MTSCPMCNREGIPSAIDDKFYCDYCREPYHACKHIKVSNDDFDCIRCNAEEKMQRLIEQSNQHKYFVDGTFDHNESNTKDNMSGTVYYDTSSNIFNSTQPFKVNANELYGYTSDQPVYFNYDQLNAQKQNNLESNMR